MICIEERKTEKVPGETSLFVSFDYNPTYVDIVKKCSGSSYHEKIKTWEIPITYLHNLLDDFCIYSDIDLKLLPPVTEKSRSISLDTSSYSVAPLEHQVEGIKYGLTHDKWLLLDAPGLGKSYEIIHIAAELYKQGKIKHCFIICGVNTLKENWRREIQKFTDLSCIILGERVTKRGTRVIGSVKERVNSLLKPIEEFFVITNIETLRSKEIANAILKGPNKFDMICIDEIHKVSNPSTLQSRNILKLKKAKYRIGATGTLITNNPLNAYVPLEWLDIERSTYTNYKYFYCIFNEAFHNMICGFQNTELLRYLIEKYSLRRTKDLLNLPPKIAIKEYVEMEADQAKFYENIKEGIHQQVDKVDLSNSTLLSILTRLRQATACPSILTSENISSSKIDRCCDLVEQITSNGEKVVVFSTFKETVRVLADRLKDYSPLICTGDTKDSQISQNVNTFQTNPECKVFIATWQKMGTGITLTASTNVIFIDLPYTAASLQQAEDRCYRIGTKSTVTVYYLIAVGTVDERVMDIVESKEALSDYLVDGEIPANSLQVLRKYVEEL